MKLHVGSVRRRNVNMQVSVDSLASGNTVARANSPTTATSLVPNRNGVFVEYGQNVPRFNAGALLGEEARVNYVRNPRGEGSSPGSPGTAPTFWTMTPATGLTQTIVGTFTVAGMQVTRVQYSGTCSASGPCAISYENAGGPTAQPAGTDVTQSAYVALFAGSLTNVSVQHWGPVVDSLSAVVQDLQPALTPALSSTMTRYQRKQTVPASGTGPYKVTGVSVLFYVTNGNTYNFTIDVGATQLELGSAASTNMLPVVGTPGPSIRGWDVITRSIAPTGYSSRNRVIGSESLSNAAWVKANSTVGVGAIAGPYTGTLGDAVIGDATSNQHLVIQVPSGTCTPGVRQSTSIYAKAGAKGFLRISPVTGFGTSFDMYYDLTTGAVSPGVIPVGAVYSTSCTFVAGGWWRCVLNYIPFFAASSTTNFMVATAVGLTVYTGDGVTPDIYLWGAQITNSTATPAYTLTTGAAAASHSKGTLVIAGRMTGALATGSFPTMASIFDDTNNHVTWIYNPFIPSIELVGTIRGVALVDSQFAYTSLPVLNQTYRLALSWDTSTGVICSQVHNGTTLSAVHTQTLDLMPVFNSLGIGTDSGGNVVLLQEFSRVALYNTAVPAASLSQLIAA